MTGMIRLGQSTFVSYPIDEDSYDRILSCIRALEHMDDDDDSESSILADAFLEASENAVANLINAEDVSSKLNLLKGIVTDNLLLSD